MLLILTLLLLINIKYFAINDYLRTSAYIFEEILNHKRIKYMSKNAFFKEWLLLSLPLYSQY